MYAEHERQIFGPYHDGQGERYADPMEVQEALHFHLDGDPNQVLKDSKSDVLEVRYRANQKLVAAVRSAFNMAPFDVYTGQGARLQDCRKTLADFLQFCAALKKNSVPSPTLQPPTASAPDPSLTRLSLDCGCS